MSVARKRVLWWGRFDPEYSRNRIMRQLLAELGCDVVDFHPCFSAMADREAALRRLAVPDLVWVPCFRQRDLAAARRWSARYHIPLLADPLISAWDKQIYERGKLAADSRRSIALRNRESALLQSADIVLADTTEHARFFKERLGVCEARVRVVYVGAEEPLFSPGESTPNPADDLLEVLFYGSFIALQGAPVIIEAARRYRGPPLRWTLIGAGPELERCQQAAADLPNVAFERWVEYAALPARIRQADILLGVFGTSAKAGRVIPNKVFQSLACGRPVVTRKSAAYPPGVAARADQGLNWVEAGDPGDLAAAVAILARSPPLLSDLGRRACGLYAETFSNRVILEQLRDALAAVWALPGRQTQ